MAGELEPTHEQPTIIHAGRLNIADNLMNQPTRDGIDSALGAMHILVFQLTQFFDSAADIPSMSPGELIGTKEKPGILTDIETLLSIMEVGLNPTHRDDSIPSLDAYCHAHNFQLDTSTQLIPKNQITDQETLQVTLEKIHEANHDLRLPFTSALGLVDLLMLSEETGSASEPVDVDAITQDALIQEHRAEYLSTIENHLTLAEELGQALLLTLSFPGTSDQGLTQHNVVDLGELILTIFSPPASDVLEMDLPFKSTLGLLPIIQFLLNTRDNTRKVSKELDSPDVDPEMLAKKIEWMLKSSHTKDFVFVADRFISIGDEDFLRIYVSDQGLGFPDKLLHPKNWSPQVLSKVRRWRHPETETHAVGLKGVMRTVKENGGKVSISTLVKVLDPKQFGISISDPDDTIAFEFEVTGATPEETRAARRNIPEFTGKRKDLFKLTSIKDRSKVRYFDHFPAEIAEFPIGAVVALDIPVLPLNKIA